MDSHEKINYLEFPAKDIEVTKAFFKAVFEWSFVDYGPDYASFTNAGIEGGLVRSDQAASVATGSVLVVFKSDQLELTQTKIEKASGTIVKPIFSFPGGRRFHFNDPNGNEFAVWSDKCE